MKKTNYVPFTSVSVDPEIQRMRDMLTSGENLMIDDDGTIGRADEPQFNENKNGTKAKTVPKAIVSFPKSNDSVQSLIDEMRGETDTPEEPEEKEDTSNDIKPKKTGVVPKSIVSTKSVSDLINEMRGETDTSEEPEEKEDTHNDITLKKTGVVPKGIVSTKSVSDLINEMRGEENSEGTIEPDDSDSDGVGSRESRTSSNPKLVPKTVVSTSQWYESNPELLMAEKAAMYDFQGNKAKFRILNDGRACWLVHCQPSIAGKDKRYCRAYDIALIYDSDHPQARYGSSVKAYLLNPTVNQLQDIVNRTKGVSPKNIPHLLRDGNGELYLCSADTKDVSTNIDSTRGITSAATSLRFALRWINIFELGLIDPVTWGKFQRHGEI